MKTEIVIYQYQDQEIEFVVGEKNVLVNATEMAKAFGKDVRDFTRLKQTEDFINACLKTGNSRFLKVENEDDLIQSRQRSGTWMHRILALKFAAWLDPEFEVWIYRTIDEIVFRHARELEATNVERASLVDQIEELRAKLTMESEDFRKLELLEFKLRQLNNRIGRINRNQLELFRAKEE